MRRFCSDMNQTLNQTKKPEQVGTGEEHQEPNAVVIMKDKVPVAAVDLYFLCPFLV